MYTIEKLKKYSYFSKLLEDKDLSLILDPLTGLVSRTYMIEFAKSLIEDKTPFSYGMIDLDNFKEVNDTYGHSIGDEILASVSERLVDFIGEDGVAGRYGGDEILFVNTKNLTYDDNYKWCEALYEKDTVLKRTYKLSTRDIFVTGTLGMATYPKDAKDYNELFSLIDKTLYRGKSKGRNCYIVFVEKLHRNIVITKLKSNTIYETFKNLTNNLSHSSNIKEKMRLGFEAIKNDIHVTDMFYLGDNYTLYSVVDNQPFLRVPDFDKFVTDDVSTIVSIRKIGDKCPETLKIFEQTEYDTLLIGKISDGQKCYGYLVCTVPKIQRIWQDSDLAIMYYFGRMLGYDIKEKIRNMEDKKELSLDLLDSVSGGSELPDNWEQLAEKLAPMYLKKYADKTFEEACDIVRTFLKDPEDQEKIINYIKKYFPDQQN